jgi:hypothetical protein
MKAFAAKRKVDWNVVLNADNAEPATRDWQNLLRLVNEALPAVEEAIRTAAASNTVLLTYPGMLGRYRQTTMLDRLRDSVGSRGANRIHGMWLLLPTDVQNPLPTIDGVPVPVLGAGQHTRIPKNWIENRHRAKNGTSAPHPTEAAAPRGSSAT